MAIHTHLIATYLHTAKERVRQIDAVWNICVKCIWKSRYAAQLYGISCCPGRNCTKRKNEALYFTTTVTVSEELVRAFATTLPMDGDIAYIDLAPPKM